MKDMNQNEDWLVTKEIYAEAILTNDPPTLQIQIPISTIHRIGIRKLPHSNLTTMTNYDTIPSRRFQYRDLGDVPSPVVQITFSHEDSKVAADGRVDIVSNDSINSMNSPQKISVQISIVEYPPHWPRRHKEEWNTWMNLSANQVLEQSGMSFSVCEYIEHESMNYFRIVDQNEIFGYSAIFFDSFQEDESWSSPDTFLVDLHLMGKEQQVVHQRGSLKEKTAKNYDNHGDEYNRHDSKSMTIHSYARNLIQTDWQKWSTYECPICFTEESLHEMMELPCEHFFCQSCLNLYIQTNLTDLTTYRHNPFICPVPTCKRDMEVLREQSKILSIEEKKQVASWKKGLTHPPTTFLKMCPRKPCKSRSMLQLSTSKTSTLVFCDDCGATYCELCLEKPKTSAEDHIIKCDPKQMMKLCRRYHLSEASIRNKCDDRWHWLKEYAEARGTANDIGALLWVSNNAQNCPTCKTAIERSDGCFHMQCSVCGTHFCYECGDEIFYPFYGTHHCWEEEEDDDDEFIGFFDPRYDLTR